MSVRNKRILYGFLMILVLACMYGVYQFSQQQPTPDTFQTEQSSDTFALNNTND